MLLDGSITPYRLLSNVGWVIATALVLADLFLLESDDVGHLGLLIGGAAATLMVRGFIHEREGRDRRMFELGRDAGSLRSID
jgi:hypothetical protein